MIRSTKVIFCDEEHGIGDVTFPAFCDLDVVDFIRTPTVSALRREARKAGWRRIKGSDYCAECVELMDERKAK